jgi:precorrin-2 dehydrogenase/sirohydrochlorin ferrochelatase
MIPLVIDPNRVDLALVGRGELAIRRLQWLREGGADRVGIYTDLPSAELVDAAGVALHRRLPAPAEIAGLHVLWIADLPEAEAARLAGIARSVGTLVNVEDWRTWCDFHSPALVRRGDLLLAVSTNGKSPGLAARIRRHLAESFGPEWAERLDRLAAKRTAWRRRPRRLDELADLTDAAIDRQGWLARGEPS